MCDLHYVKQDTSPPKFKEEKKPDHRWSHIVLIERRGHCTPNVSVLYPDRIPTVSPRREEEERRRNA